MGNYSSQLSTIYLYLYHPIFQCMDQCQLECWGESCPGQML